MQNRTKKPESREKVIRLAAWLSESGIQVSSGEDLGAVSAWLEEPSGRGSYLYPESTGYLISVIANLRHVDDDPSWIRMARDAGNWLVSVALNENGLFLGRKYAGHSPDVFSFENGHVALFDNCMAGYALTNLYRMTGDEKYLRHAVEVADTCLNVFFDDDLHLVGPVFDIKRNSICEQRDHWSLHNGPFLLKCVLFLVSISRETRSEGLLKAVDTLLRLARDRQLREGGFRTDRAARQSHLHPHSYAVEGLLFLAHEFQREDLLDSARAAIDFSFRVCLGEPGQVRHSWPSMDNYCGARLRSDAIAQILRAHYISKLLDDSPSTARDDQVEELIAVMDGFQMANGGTGYGTSMSGSQIAHANSWCHIFRLEMEIFRYCYLNKLGLPGSTLVIA